MKTSEQKTPTPTRQKQDKIRQKQRILFGGLVTEAALDEVRDHRSIFCN